MDYTKEEIIKLRQDEPWLKQYDLSDDDFFLTVNSVVRVILGTDSLEVFFKKINDLFKEKEVAKKIALQAAMERFLQFHDYIIGLDEFIKMLGGKLPEIKESAPPETRELNSDDTAKMVFSSTDEEEIKALPAIEHDLPSSDDYEAQAQIIIKEFGFKDKDEIIIKRLRNFIIGKLRDVRDDIELLEVLTKSRKIGGLELEEEKARLLIKLINDRKNDFHNGLMPRQAPTNIKRIEFPAYQETKEKKPVAAAENATDETSAVFKPITLEEKRKKDGFETSPITEVKSFEPEPSKITEEETSLSPSSRGPAAGGQGLPAPLGISSKKEPIVIESTAEDLPIDNQGTFKKSFAGLPSKDEVYPIIEEEDGLPVIRMPEEMMVAPKIIVPAKRKEPSPVPSPVTDQIVPQSSPVPPQRQPVPQTSVQEISTFTGMTTAQPLKPGVVVPKEALNESRPIYKTPDNLPPPKPAPYIAPAKTLPPKAPMLAAKRPSLDDVKFVRKLIGPVEELETMTIIDFRRMSPDPATAAKKIKEKVGLLEKELYAKRAQGIDAWHKSEVARFYRLLGQAAMSESRSIEQIIAERQQAGKPTLTIEEFNAIMELNKELRY